MNWSENDHASMGISDALKRTVCWHKINPKSIVGFQSKMKVISSRQLRKPAQEQ